MIMKLDFTLSPEEEARQREEDAELEEMFTHTEVPERLAFIDLLVEAYTRVGILSTRSMQTLVNHDIAPDDLPYSKQEIKEAAYWTAFSHRGQAYLRSKGLLLIRQTRAASPQRCHLGEFVITPSAAFIRDFYAKKSPTKSPA